MSGQLLYQVALSILKPRYLRKIHPLIRDYPAEDIFYFLKPDFTEGIARHISSVYRGDVLTAAAEIISSCGRRGYSVIPLNDPRYPAMLKEIYDPPPVIYTSGISGLNKPVAVVGTRNADRQSSAFTEKFCAELAASGCDIISGMARGIDRSAHCGALNAGGRTAGVLANGIDSRYPSENSDVYRRITESEDSFLVSEYPPGVISEKWTFVRRNRIISGMSAAVVIVKASAKSGALITAGYAVDQNREVFVCPGNSFDSGYEGCNNLIRQGAELFMSAQDVISFLGRQTPARKPKPEAIAVKTADCGGKNTDPAKDVYEPGSIESKIIDSVMNKVHSIDEISRSLGADSGLVGRKIIEMELDGRIYLEGSRIKLAGVKV